MIVFNLALVLFLSLNGCISQKFEQYRKCDLLFNREIEGEESGIEGILNRLEKERSNSFGLGFREKEESFSSENNEDEDKWDHRTTADAVRKYYPLQILQVVPQVGSITIYIICQKIIFFFFKKKKTLTDVGILEHQDIGIIFFNGQNQFLVLTRVLDFGFSPYTKKILIQIRTVILH